MMGRIVFVAVFALLLLLAATNGVALTVSDDLPSGVMRGPLLREHSFHAPLVDDWWEEGVPHFMVGGSAVVNEKFLRLTSANLEQHGFAFNTAPMDHENWELRFKFSVRAPPVVAGLHSTKGALKYQGGDGMALWYLRQPIGDDHQHVVKYSKSLSPELIDDVMDRENPWRLADELLSADDDEENIYDGVDESDLTDEEISEKKRIESHREQKRKKQEELFRRIFKRGTSVDDSDDPRIMGVKYSDFTDGFAVVIDSVGDEQGHLQQHKEAGNALEHHHHKASISLLLNLPNHTASSGAKIVNNYNPMQNSFRDAKQLLHCQYDFRQDSTKPYDPAWAKSDTATKLLKGPEQPLEMVLRYYEKKLTLVIRREDVSQRKLLIPDEENDENVDVQRTYRETLCGELYPITIPQKYHFGLSASTGHRPKKERRFTVEESLYHSRKQNRSAMHVDIHDVYQLELRELGLDAKAMGYSKSIPVEHFDYENDRREREHFSRQIPVTPDADES